MTSVLPEPKMAFCLDRSVAVLRRTPVVLDGLLGGLDEFWTRSNYGTGTFSPFDVVGHLIQADRHDWLPRARIILEHGAARPFPPFDRYAMYEADRGKGVADLLAEFAAGRAACLADLATLALTDADFDRAGTHPDLGPVTLRQLLATWVVHDLGHLHQVAKAMAYQYRDEVGAWREYLTILPRA
jgi:hypothetical protein